MAALPHTILVIGRLWARDPSEPVVVTRHGSVSNPGFLLAWSCLELSGYPGHEKEHQILLASPFFWYMPAEGHVKAKISGERQSAAEPEARKRTPPEPKANIAEHKTGQPPNCVYVSLFKGKPSVRVV